MGRTISRLWPLFVLSWPAFVVIGPIAGMLDAANTRAEVVATLVWSVAFLVAYLWLTLHESFRIGARPTEQRVRIGMLALLTGMVLYVDLAYPPGWFWLFICVIVPAGVVLPPRAAACTVIGITALAVGIEVARSGWAMAQQVIGISMWGVSAIMLRQLMLTVDELRTAREERARLAVIEERLRFARDLHDLLGHSLSLIALKSELAGRLAGTQGSRAAAEIADIERVARRALREVREAVAGYRCPSLTDELVGAREALAAAGIEACIHVQDRSLPPGVDGVLAWVIREGVTNVIRHSDAGRCVIRVECGEGVARASIVDDGRGAPATMTAATMGSGLAGIAERVASTGGRLEAGPDDTGGFALRVTLPIERSSSVMVPSGEAQEKVA